MKIVSKKLICVILAAMCLLSLTGCGDSRNSSVINNTLDALSGVKNFKCYLNASTSVEWLKTTGTLSAQGTGTFTSSPPTANAEMELSFGDICTDISLKIYSVEDGIEVYLSLPDLGPFVAGVTWKVPVKIPGSEELGLYASIAALLMQKQELIKVGDETTLSGRAVYPVSITIPGEIISQKLPEGKKISDLKLSLLVNKETYLPEKLSADLTDLAKSAVRTSELPEFLRDAVLKSFKVSAEFSGFNSPNVQPAV